MVDALDKNKVWYTATVVWVDPRFEKGEDTAMPMIKVGFRQYQEDGEKSDEMGAYYGYSSALDEIIGMWSARIQKPFTQTKMADLTGNTVKISDEDMAKLSASMKSAATVISDWEKQSKQDVKDMEQVTEEGAVIVAVERESCKSPLLVELLKRFSEAQGFESILEVIGQPETSLEGVKNLVTLITNAVPMYHKSFVDAYIERFKNVTESKLVSADASQLRTIQFPKIEDIVEKLWLKLMKRKQPDTEIQIGKY